MKTIRHLVLPALIGGVLCTVPYTPAAANPFYWWGDDTNELGGSGAWTSTSTNWSTSDQQWLGQANHGNNNNGIFAGTSGVVTVNGTINFRSINFDVDGYELTGGTNPVLARNSDMIVAARQSGVTATITGITFSQGARTVFVGHDSPYENLGTVIFADNTFSSTRIQIRGGTVVLEGTNTFDAGAASRIEINSGTLLQIGTGGTTGTLGTGTVINNAALVVNRSGELELDQVISGSGTLTNIGSGTLVLSGENTYGGATTIQNGTIALGGHDRLPTATTLSLADTAGATFDLRGYNQQIGRLTDGGSSGGMIVNSGDVTSVLTMDPKSGDHIYDGTIEGDIRVVLVGNRDLIYSHRQRLTSSNNTYTGGTLIDGFALSANVDGSLGAVPGEFDAENIIIQNGGVLFNSQSVLTLHPNRGITLGDGGGGLLAGWSNRNVTINGAISGEPGNDLTILPNHSTVIFAGNNTYGGRTILSGSISRLQIGNGGTTGTLGAGNVTNHGVLTFNRSDELTVANRISGSGTVTQAGDGTLVLTGENIYTGTTTISAGTLQVGDGGTTGTLGSGTVTNNAALVVYRSGELELDQVISGSGTLTNMGSGTLVLLRENTYEGTTTIQNGTIALAGGHNRLPTTTALSFSSAADTTATLDLGGYNQRIGALTAASGSGGSIVNSGDVTSVLTIDPKSGQHTYDGTIEGDIRVELVGNQNLTYSNRQRLTNSNNTYTGGTLIDGFALSANVDGSLGTVPDTFDAQNIIIQNGGLLFNNDSVLTLDANRGITLGSGGGGFLAGWNKHVIIAGAIAGDAGNDLTIVRNNGIVILTGDNAYAGKTILQTTSGGNASRLQIGDGGTAGTLGSGDVINNGFLMFNRSDQLTVANAISGSGALTQAGDGTLVLTGENSYTGTTTVEAGTLLVNNTTGSGTGSGPVVVEEDAILGGTGIIAGATTIEHRGAVSPGVTIGRLTFENALTLAGGSKIHWEFDGKETAGEDYDSISGLGLDAGLYLPEPPNHPDDRITLSIFGPGATLKPGDSFTLFDGDVFDHNAEPFAFGADLNGLFTIDDQSGWWGTWDVTGGSLMLTAVPEPGTWLMALAALVGGLLVRRRR